MDSLVRTLNDHLKFEPEPPDLRPSSNVNFPVAWITGPATDPSLNLKSLNLTNIYPNNNKSNNKVKSKPLEL
jgi:hypothetical protein